MSEGGTVVRTADIIAFVEDATGHGLNSDEGVQHGTAQDEVGRVAVCWMASREALARAGQDGTDLVIGHESLYYPYNAFNRDDIGDGWRDWPVNRNRREALDAHELTFARLHGSLDEMCIFDVFADLLGLGEPVEADGLAKFYEIEPCSVADLVERVTGCMGMGPLRVAAPGGLSQIVSRIGLPWGGLGLFVNVGYMQRLLDMGCDAFVAGESDSYGFRFAAEGGVPIIETSHEDSENPGLRRFCELLAERFPEIEVDFIEVVRPWDWA
jgi:putative NIF3 family GTP cyclohydrolase 1 type 2